MNRGGNRDAEKGATRGCVERLGLQIWSDALAGLDQASRASELAANRRWLLSGRLSLATSTPPHIAPFSAPLHTDAFEPRTSVRRHQEKCITPLQAIRGSASPQGEARRKAPPSLSEAPGAAGRIKKRCSGCPPHRRGRSKIATKQTRGLRHSAKGQPPWSTLPSI